MRFAQIGAAAALAGVSLAFLLPPTVTDTELVKALPFEAEAFADSRVIEVSCPGCPVQTTSEGAMHWGNAESVLRLNFTVEHKDIDYLTLNGLQIYPIDPLSSAFLTPLTADQLIKTPDNTWAYSSSPKLGYSLSVKHPVTADRERDLNLAVFRLQIIEVADQFIRGIPSIELKLLETPSRKLMIGTSDIQSVQSEVSVPVQDNECADLICKWKAIISDRLKGLKKGCGKKAAHGQHGRPRPFHSVKGGPKKHSHNRPHGHHRRPHRASFIRFIRSITLHIVLPIFIGIAVGAVASLVGMVFGHLVVFIWRSLFRRGQRGQYCRVRQEEASADAEDENKGFLENQGPPPVYEDAVKDGEEKTEEQ